MLAQKELAGRLQRALDHLPFDQRTVVILREIDGPSGEEIAHSFGLAVGTVKSRLTRDAGAPSEELRGGENRMTPLPFRDARRLLDAYTTIVAVDRAADRGWRTSRVVC